MELWNLNTALNTAIENAESTAETLAEETAAVGDLSALLENFNPMNFVNNLTYMGVGMLGIFIVMGVLIIGTAVLNKVTNRASKKNSDE